MAAATDSTIANNTVFANGSSGMGGGIVTGVGDKPGNIQLKNTKVINNIVYKNPRQGISRVDLPSPDTALIRLPSKLGTYSRAN